MLGAYTADSQILSYDKRQEILFIAVGVCFFFNIQNQKLVDNGCNSYLNSIILLIMWIYAWNFVCYNFMVMSVFNLLIDFSSLCTTLQSEGRYTFDFLTMQNITLHEAMNRAQFIVQKCWMCSTVHFVLPKCRTGIASIYGR